MLQLLLSFSLVIQLTGGVKFRILEKGTKEPIRGAQVKMAATPKGAMTNYKGEGYIKGITPDSSYTFYVTFVGYIRDTVKDVHIYPDSIVTITRELQPRLDTQYIRLPEEGMREYKERTGTVNTKHNIDH